MSVREVADYSLRVFRDVKQTPKHHGNALSHSYCPHFAFSYRGK